MKRKKRSLRCVHQMHFYVGHMRRHATSFLNFSAMGHTTSPCINGYHDLVFYSITLLEKLYKIFRCKNFNIFLIKNKKLSPLSMNLLNNPPILEHSYTVDGFIFVGTNFHGLSENDTFMGFKVRGHSIFLYNPYRKLHGYWNSWIGPSTKTTKIGILRKLSHTRYYKYIRLT